MEKQGRILWVDDEIELLKPYFIFLEEKGYELVTATNGQDALELFRAEKFDIVFLDENMPGANGLKVLSELKKIDTNTPVVMITKSEEEDIMDMAIGNKITDYLTKPVNPNQILLTLKKTIHRRAIMTEQVTSGYRNDFGQIGMQLSDKLTHEEWVELYKKLVHWDLALDETDTGMHEILQMQWAEANTVFTKYIKENYARWFQQPDTRPLISPDLFRKRIFPLMDAGERVFMVVLDNFRFDQWRVVQNILSEYFTFDSEELYYSILPTTTQYARNAIFAGLMPLQIAQMFPDFWVGAEEDEGKNQMEDALIQTQLDRFRRKCSFSYYKINQSQGGEQLIEQLPQLIDNPLNVCVLNFIDMLSHARTESKMIRELASSESAYRSLAVSWFRHSSTLRLFKELAQKQFKVVVTTDHGAIRVQKAIKVRGNKNTSVNMRFKLGKQLSYNPKEVFAILQPEKFGLPSPDVSSTYIFATGSNFFAYPNNYNYYVTYYRDTFQHGGISLEEMMVPFIVMSPR